MEIFVDTADLDKIKQANSWGITDGVTTNPSLIKKAVEKKTDIEMDEYIENICKEVNGPVSLEVIGLSQAEMVREAETLYDKFNHVNDNVVIKIPVNTNSDKTDKGKYEGIKTISELSEKGIPINTTLIMRPEQALLAAKAGAEYVSPFLGRIDDYIRSSIGLERGEDYSKYDYQDPNHIKNIIRSKLEHRYREKRNKEPKDIYQDKGIKEVREKRQDNGIRSGVHMIKSIKQIFNSYNYNTKILAASIRNTRQVREVAEAGAEVATIPFSVIEDMIEHHKTREGIKSFSKDVVPEYREIFQ